MLTIVLPGRSPLNSKWLDEIEKEMGSELELYLHRWRAWENGVEFDFDLEIKQILEVIQEEEKVNFIAKSIGTKVLSKLIPEVQTRVNKIILCGIPIDPFNYYKLLTDYTKENLLIIQNSKDPYVPYRAVSIYLKLINSKVNLVERNSNTHDYPYYEIFKNWLRNGDLPSITS